MLEYNGYFINCFYDKVKKTFQVLVIGSLEYTKILLFSDIQDTERAALNKAMDFIDNKAQVTI